VADDERPAVGTVAEEAARLLDALGGWASSAQAGYAARSTPGPASPGAEDSVPVPPSPGAEDSATEAPEAPNAHGAPDGPDSAVPRCPTCGAENGAGQAVACQLCPVCQGIGLLRSVRPETVDRLADLAGALAATLRDIAGQRRADAGAAAPRKAQPHSSRVHDIAVDDEDVPGSATS
jgi:hypothetical protein